MSERFVIVHRSYDPIQADLLGDLLRDSGVNARVTGTRSGAIIGVAQNILEVHIAVPESQAGQATDFLEAYFAAEEAAPTGDEPGDAEDEPAGEQAPPRELRPLLAAGSAFLTFGMGHVYARRPGTAAALLVGQLVAMGLLFGGSGWSEWTAGLTTLGGVVGCDLVGAVMATRAHRRGVRRGRVWQSAVGVAYVSGAFLAAYLAGPHLLDTSEPGPTGQHPNRHGDPLNEVRRPLEHDPSFPPLTSEHPANPSARHRP